MSRSIHKTIAQVIRDNSRQEIAHPDNPDVAALAQKVGYKKSERRKRQGTAQDATLTQDDEAGPNNSFKPTPLRGAA
ncbi:MULTISPECIES: hypothetical protein [unclassified Luteimonas]